MILFLILRIILRNVYKYPIIFNTLIKCGMGMRLKKSVVFSSLLMFVFVFMSRIVFAAPTDSIFSAFNELGKAFNLLDLDSSGIAFAARFTFVFGLFYLITISLKKGFKMEKVGAIGNVLIVVILIGVEFVLEKYLNFSPIDVFSWSIYIILALLTVASFLFKNESGDRGKAFNIVMNILLLSLTAPIVFGLGPLSPLSPLTYFPYGLGAVCWVVWVIYAVKVFMVDIFSSMGVTKGLNKMAEGTFLGKEIGQIISEHGEKSAEKKAREEAVGPAIKYEKEQMKKNSNIRAVLAQVKTKVENMSNNAAAGKISFEEEKSKELPSMLKAVDLISVDNVAQSAEHKKLESMLAFVRDSVQKYGSMYEVGFVKGVFKDLVLQKKPNTFLAAFVVSDYYNKSYNPEEHIHAPSNDFANVVSALKVSLENSIFNSKDTKLDILRMKLSELSSALRSFTSDVSSKQSIVALIDEISKTFEDGVKLTQEELKELKEVDSALKTYAEHRQKHEEKVIAEIEKEYVKHSSSLIGHSKSPERSIAVISSVMDSAVADFYKTLVEYDTLTFGSFVFF